MIEENNWNPCRSTESKDESPPRKTEAGGHRERAGWVSSLARPWGWRFLAIVLVAGLVSAEDSSVDAGPTPSASGGKQRESEPGATSARRVPDALKFANGLLRQRKFDLAAEEYDRFLAGDPKGLDRIDALFGLGNAQLYQGRYKEARRAFETFLKEAPADSRRTDRSLPTGRAVLPIGRFPGRSSCPRGVHIDEGRSSGSGDRLDLPGRCLLRIERPARCASGLRTILVGVSARADGRSRSIWPGPDPRRPRRARSGTPDVPRSGAARGFRMG